MTSSLRARLLAGISLAGVAVLGLLGLSVYAAMRHALMADFDASLRTDARLVAGMIDQDGPKVTFEFDPRQMPDFLSQDRQCYFEIRRDDGSVLARSPSLGNQDLPQPASMDVIGRTQLPGSHSGRAVMISYSDDEVEPDEKQPGPPPHPVSILVAAAPLEVQRTLTLLAGMLTALCAAAVIIMGMVQLRVVARAVKPVKQLARDIESLGETDLYRRFPPATVPAELRPVVEKLNGLLARIEQAFARERCFTADVAHELRTPLAGLRSTLEVCRSRPRQSLAYEAALDECRGITDRMEAMVQSLLLLARSDAGQIKIESRAFDLCKTISQTLALIQYRAEHRRLKLAINMPPTCPAASDPDKLQIVLKNVLDNAVSYADDDGTLRVSVTPGDDGPTLEIANSGSQIDSADAPRLFQRFWRGDTSRTDANLHCGLGLSLSQRLMTLIGGTISIETTRGGEFIVRLHLPPSAH